MTAGEDRFTGYDAAYVLGALSPEDRQEFEQHLHGCARCAAAVRELAGLPGLLAQVDPPQLGGPASEPPPELLADVLRRVRRGRRLRNAVTSVSAAVAVSACVALAVVAALPSPVSPVVPVTPVTPAVTMQALGQFPVTADARLDAQDWGTQVDMSCSYKGGRSGGAYALVAVAHDGTVTELATWKAVPDNTARIVVGTALRRGDMAALEVRSGSGRALLRLTL